MRCGSTDLAYGHPQLSSDICCLPGEGLALGVCGFGACPAAAQVPAQHRAQSLLGQGK